MNTVSLVDRIEALAVPEPNTGCWLWIGSLNKVTGYGSLQLAGKRAYAHRVSYEAYVGPIPPGLWIDHLCRVHACVNPDHLEPVTPSVNTRRSPIHNFRVQMAKEFCPQGHPYSENAYRYPKHPSHRFCRKCMTADQKARRARNRMLKAGAA